MANISSNTYIKPYYLITLGNQHQLNVSVQRKDTCTCTCTCNSYDIDTCTCNQTVNRFRISRIGIKRATKIFIHHYLSFVLSIPQCNL